VGGKTPFVWSRTNCPFAKRRCTKTAARTNGEVLTIHPCSQAPSSCRSPSRSRARRISIRATHPSVTPAASSGALRNTHTAAPSQVASGKCPVSVYIEWSLLSAIPRQMYFCSVLSFAWPTNETEGRGETTAHARVCRMASGARQNAPIGCWCCCLDARFVRPGCALHVHPFTHATCGLISASSACPRPVARRLAHLCTPVRSIQHDRHSSSTIRTRSGSIMDMDLFRGARGLWRLAERPAAAAASTWWWSLAGCDRLACEHAGR
jgi:hypothetical protein